MPKRAAAMLALSCFAVLPLHAQAPRMGGPVIHAFGFGDANFLTTERSEPDGFLMGQVVGHMSAAMTDRLGIFGEVSASARNTGYVIEIERAIVRYDFADALKLSIGRYHTPISYWNTAFHHGLWLQTSVARPQMIRFGSRTLPVHFVGVLAEGALPTGPVGLGYTLGVGNGRQSDNVARAGDAGDPNSDLAWTAGLSLRPPALLGLQVGGSIYTDQIDLTAGPVDEQILSAHAVLSRESPEVLAEFSRVRHETATATTTNNGYYAQVGYRLPGGAHAFKPYVRFERVDVAAGDPLLAVADVEYEGVIAGLRIDFASFAAAKAEYRNDRVGTTGDRLNSLWLQVSFAVSGGGGEAMYRPMPQLLRGWR